MVIDGGSGGRVVDYVQLNRLDTHRDLSDELSRLKTRKMQLPIWGINLNTRTEFWMPSLTLPEGVLHQIRISLDANLTDNTDWTDNGLPPDTKAAAIANFVGFMYNPTIESNSTQVPFTPTAKIRQMIKWEANDPLVHYLVDDLNYLDSSTNDIVQPPNAIFPLVTSSLWKLNERYSPWGGNGPKTGGTEFGVDPNMYNIALKDPLVRSSDDWDFPTSKFPNIGWLGRVHRYTPWQTAYLKSADILRTSFSAWQKWSGSANPVIASNIAPFNDRRLFDLFTASVNENASRGRLSVNQTNLAAWSAVLSGVIVLSNSPAGLTNVFISPAGVYSPLALPPVAQIVQGINLTRTNMALFPNQVFKNLGDILATPQLSDASPFLITNSLQTFGAGGISDAVMERIPQQIMGLLTFSHTPRFVVYSYGQTLHPADHSIQTAGGTFFGLCTNYQITAETATRAVIRVEGSPDPRYATTPDNFGNKYPPRIVVEQFNVLPP
jgi:hypothetical protein